jgi:hypothetical protein
MSEIETFISGLFKKMSAGNLNPLLVRPRLPPTQVQIEHCVFDVAQQRGLSTHVCMCTLSLGDGRLFFWPSRDFVDRKHISIWVEKLSN